MVESFTRSDGTDSRRSHDTPPTAMPAGTLTDLHSAMPSIAQLEKLLAADPADPFILYGLAQEHAREGRFDVAVTFYDRCLEADPNYLYAYFHKAKALEEAGRVDDAVAALRLGLDRAKAAREPKAMSEIGAYLDELT